MSDLLYTHQDAGADWLAARTAGYLGDTPGLGKTRTILAALKRLGPETNTLVVTPAIVRSHWRREADLLGINPLVYSYHEIVNGGEKMMAQLTLEEEINTLVLDEAHYAKSAGAQRSNLLLGPNGYARRVERVYLASGTPIPKHVGELWTQLVNVFPEVLDRHRVRGYAQWMARFAITRGSMVRGTWVEKVVGQQNVEELREILAEVMLRRTLDDVGLDVPEIDWQVVRLNAHRVVSNEELFGFDMSDDMDAGLREYIAARGEEALDNIKADPHVARMRRRLGELKAPLVVEMLNQQLAAGDEKVVVFAHHRSVLDTLRTHLRPFGVAYIDGDTTPTARDREIDGFQNGRARVFIGQTIACQTGITLTAARRAVMVEPDWTASVNHQAGHRIARIGQVADHCIVQMIALADTLDEAIVGQNARETRHVAEILGVEGK